MTNPADEVQAIAVEADATAELPMPDATPTHPNESVPVAVRLKDADVAVD